MEKFLRITALLLCLCSCENRQQVITPNIKESVETPSIVKTADSISILVPKNEKIIAPVVKSNIKEEIKIPQKIESDNLNFTYPVYDYIRVSDDVTFLSAGWDVPIPKPSTEPPKVSVTKNKMFLTLSLYFFIPLIMLFLELYSVYLFIPNFGNFMLYYNNLFNKGE